MGFPFFGRGRGFDGFGCGGFGGCGGGCGGGFVGGCGGGFGGWGGWDGGCGGGCGRRAACVTTVARRVCAIGGGDGLGWWN